LGIVRPPPWSLNHPQWPNPKPFYFFSFWHCGGSQTTPMGNGSGSATPKPTLGVAPLAKMGVAGHPFIIFQKKNKSFNFF
jgi:hypothetical protein